MTFLPNVMAERIALLKSHGVLGNLEEIAHGQLLAEVIASMSERAARGQALTRDERKEESRDKLLIKYEGADPEVVSAFLAPVYLPPGKRGASKGKRRARAKKYGPKSSDFGLF
jgi:hypothetical protein